MIRENDLPLFAFFDLVGTLAQYSTYTAGDKIDGSNLPPNESFHPRQSIFALLQLLSSENYHLMLTTSTSVEQATPLLENAGLEEFFSDQNIVSGERLFSEGKRRKHYQKIIHDIRKIFLGQSELEQINSDELTSQLRYIA